MRFTMKDLTKIEAAILQVEMNRRKDMSAKMSSSLSCGEFTVYHLGARNPVVRIDLKLREVTDDEGKG